MVQDKAPQFTRVYLHVSVVSIQLDLTFHSGLGTYCSALYKNPPDTSVCDKDTEDDLFGSKVKFYNYAYKLI